VPPVAGELAPVACDELPPVAALLALLEEPPWLVLGAAAELPPTELGPEFESLEHAMTSAGRPTHKVPRTAFLIAERGKRGP
jgi:hypothetical protein